MAHKGERYKQMPTLWHIGWGYPCEVMRKRKGERRWTRRGHGVLTMATARRWSRLQAQGKAIIRRDVNYEVSIQFGISRVPKRSEWAR